MRVLLLALVMCAMCAGCGGDVDPTGIMPGSSSIVRTPDGHGEMHTYTLGSITGQIVEKTGAIARIRMNPWWTLEIEVHAGFKTGDFVDVGRRGNVYYVIEEVTSQTGVR